MKIGLLFLLVICSVRLDAQDDYYTHFNTDEFWQHMMVDDAGTTPSFNANDTTMIVATARALQPGNVRIFSEQRDDPDSAIRIFFVYTSDGNWHFHREPSLESALQRMPHPNNDWVIYTEGMGKIMSSNTDRGLRMTAVYGVNVLLLDYPSIQSNVGSVKNYKFAMSNARAAYKDFVPVIDRFKALHQRGETGAGHVTLFFHSMGNNVVREMVLNNRLDELNDEVWVDNLVLNAPCVPNHAHAEWVDKIAFARNIYIHYNHTDGTLKWARLAAFHQILGEHVSAPLSIKAVYIDFSLLCGKDHSNFLSIYGRQPARPKALWHYGTLFHGKAVNMDDLSRYATSQYHGIGSMILP